MNKPKIKIVIVDDHRIFRKGLKTLLKQMDFVEVVGVASDGMGLLEMLKIKDVDIVLMDIKMPGMNGVEATEKALEIKPDLKVVALSMFEEVEYVSSIIDVGAKGYLLKNVEEEELEKALLLISKGKTYYSNELSSLIIGELLGSENIKKEKTENVKLTNRETDVIKLICKGLTNQQIAEELELSQRTIDSHRTNLLAKIGVHNTVGLVKYAVKNKMVEF